MEELIPNEKNKVLFGNIVRSDGFCVDFIFYRRTFDANGDDTLIQNHNLGVDDFSIDEITQLYRTSFLYPGRKTVYTTAMGLDEDQHEIRRCTSKENYHLAGSMVYTKKLQQRRIRQVSLQLRLLHLQRKLLKIFLFYDLQITCFQTWIGCSLFMALILLISV
ncbi:hypothetical protein BCV71DRAFT_280620 [Rhizopus microsporus]|uniref:Uncharacterized protein n=1 Tax=Rhizopus microsporus TaxID=58291 RepID=A0A1X0RKI9_RHIZD|nr:hypothetical protein BCV71DRAFT_280620 [Rhizopus microsporus]